MLSNNQNTATTLTTKTGTPRVQEGQNRGQSVWQKRYAAKLAAFRLRQEKRRARDIAKGIPVYERTDAPLPPGTAVTVLLTKGRHALVDLEDEPLVRQFRWRAKMDEQGNWYALRQFRQVDGHRKQVSMHREIMGVTDPSVIVDHKNGDGLDNRRSQNLRICTNTQNIRNSRAHIDKKDSKLKGVYFNREVGKFRAQIMRDRVKYNLGNFVDEESAARAYDDAARGMFGEFARCNFAKPEVSLPVAAVSR